jgi:hypothetical protein
VGTNLVFALRGSEAFLVILGIVAYSGYFKPSSRGHSFLQNLFQARFPAIPILVADPDRGFIAGEQAA